MRAKICDWKKVLNSFVYVWLKIKGCKGFKTYLHGEHLLVICRLLAVWTRGGGGKEKKTGRGDERKEKEVMRRQESS